MDQQPHILYNPAAGKGRAGRILPRVRELLRKHGAAYDLTITRGPGHAQELSQSLAEAGCPAVVAAGGDGTVNEVINGLMRAQMRAQTRARLRAQLNGSGRPALGVLPIGRGNDFAFGCGIPLDLDAACATLARSDRCAIDIGRVTGGDYPDGRYFGNGVGLGFDAVVGFEAAKMKRIQGFLSYLAAVWNAMFIYAKAPVYEITYDDQHMRRAFLMVSTMNGRRLGGMFMVAPHADIQDGQFDVCLAGAVSQIGILGIVPRFIRGTQAEHPEVSFIRVRRISVRSVEGGIPAHADGETISTNSPEITIEVIPSSLEVITQLNGRRA